MVALFCLAAGCGGGRAQGSSDVAITVSRVASVQVRRWSVGDVQLPPTAIVEANLPFGGANGGVQGLLGSDMLSRFDVVTIDYAHSRLVLRPHASH